MAPHEGTFEEAADKALVALGADPAGAALDAWTDPAGAAQALGAEGASFVVRGAFELPFGEAGLGPEPSAPGWIRVTRGSPEIRMCSALATCETRKVTRVVVEAQRLPEGAEGVAARVSLALDRRGTPGPQLLVAEAWARTEEIAVGRVRAFAGRLARALSVPASLPAAGGEEAAEEAAIEGDPAAQASARALARFSLRTEGPRLVLRDFASQGPREGVGIHALIGVLFAGAAGAAWWMFVQSGRDVGYGAATSMAWLGGAALLSLAMVAFLGVTRFALKYRATSAPLVAFGAGKVMVAPWVGRNGAIMTAPEGRFGAGIDLGEVRGVSVQDRKGRLAVEVDTEHGPIDAVLVDDRGVAEHLSAALGRAIEDLRPAGAGPSAKQRYRMRAATGARPEPAAAGAK